MLGKVGVGKGLADRAMSCMLDSGSHGLRGERMNTGVGFPENTIDVIVS